MSAPGAVIYSLAGNFWVHETPEEVQERKEAAMTEGEDLQLTGLEPQGPHEQAAFPLFIAPNTVLAVRGVSEKLFEKAEDEREEAEKKRRESPMSGMLERFGIQLPGGAGVLLDSGHQRQNTEPDEICCCSHMASLHVEQTEPGEPRWGECGVPDCECKWFHEHGPVPPEDQGAKGD